MANKLNKLLNKLLLVRKAEARSTLLDKMEVSKFASGDPLNISPRTWHDEAGLSHYGYILKDMNLKDVKALEKWILKNNSEAITLHEFNPDADNPLEEALNSVGLRINEVAEE